LSSSVRGLDAMRRSSHGQRRGAIQPLSCANRQRLRQCGYACFQRSNVGAHPRRLRRASDAGGVGCSAMMLIQPSPCAPTEFP
jgi:hypothetical protein